MQRKVLISIALGGVLVCALAFFLPWKKPDQKDLVEAFQTNCGLAARMSRISILIEQGDLAIALEESLRIDDEFKNQEATSSLVQSGAITRVLNAKRIAELYRTLGLFQEEVDAWQSLETMLSSSYTAQSEAVFLIENGLQEEGLDLKSYILACKKEALAKL